MDENVEYLYFSLTGRVELRADAAGGGNVISGPVVRYGDKCSLGGLFCEQIAAGAFGAVGDLDVTANIQHDRSRLVGRTGGAGLELREDSRGVYATLTEVDTPSSRDAFAAVRAGLLRGWSVEMKVKRHSYTREVRHVLGATMVGLALVDRPAYTKSTLAVRDQMSALVVHSRHEWSVTIL